MEEPKIPKTLKYFSQHAVLKHGIDDPELEKDFLEKHLDLIPRYQLETLTPFKWFMENPDVGLWFSASAGFVEAFKLFRDLGATKFDDAIRNTVEIPLIKFFKIVKLVSEVDKFWKKFWNVIPIDQLMILSEENLFKDLVKNPNEGLKVSAGYGLVEAFKLFEELGADDYDNAIAEAVDNQAFKIIKLCIESGRVSEFGLSIALGLALRTKNQEIIEYLKDFV